MRILICSHLSYQKRNQLKSLDDNDIVNLYNQYLLRQNSEKIILSNKIFAVILPQLFASTHSFFKVSATYPCTKLRYSAKHISTSWANNEYQQCNIFLVSYCLASIKFVSQLYHFLWYVNNYIIFTYREVSPHLFYRSGSVSFFFYICSNDSTPHKGTVPYKGRKRKPGDKEQAAHYHAARSVSVSSSFQRDCR